VSSNLAGRAISLSDINGLWWHTLPLARFARVSEALRKNRDGFRRFFGPPGLTPRAHARKGHDRAHAREGHDPAPSPTVRSDHPARSPGPGAENRIARSSAGSGSHLVRMRDRGLGFPPPGGLGPIGEGGPGQTLIRVLDSKSKWLKEILWCAH
jgi:hypothetical protein